MNTRRATKATPPPFRHRIPGSSGANAAAGRGRGRRTNLFRASLVQRGLLLLPDSRARTGAGLFALGMILFQTIQGAGGPAESPKLASRAVRHALVGESEKLRLTQSAPAIRTTKTDVAATSVAKPSEISPVEAPVVAQPTVTAARARAIAPIDIRAPELRSFLAKRTEDGGAELSFSTHLLFEPGTANLTPEGRARILDVIAQVKASGFVGSKVSVHGHTDDSPVVRNRRLYPTNWELSGGRAFAVVRLFEHEGFDPSRLEGSGHGQWQPLVPNRDLEGLPFADNRIENRRLVIRLSAPGNPEDPMRTPASAGDLKGSGP